MSAQVRSLAQDPTTRVWTLIWTLIGPASCVSCVSWWYWTYAAETHETVHWESGMPYHHSYYIW
jgi:hypothetical protein